MIDVIRALGLIFVGLLGLLVIELILGAILEIIIKILEGKHNE